METTYFLYPIHVSLSFLFCSTLSASLYLMLLRFLNRSYEEVFRLASTIGTDAAYTPEEGAIFKIFGRSNSDCHPDAHACRLKIALVTFDSPVACPFDLTQQMSRYITKLDHVSAVCRIGLAEELQLLETCVCDSSDPRFYHPETGDPLYSHYEVTVVKNRKYYLRALLSGESKAEVFVPPRETGSRWPCDINLSALLPDMNELITLKVSYSAPGESSAEAIVDLINKFFSGQEVMTGAAVNLGFLFIYELLTGTKKARLTKGQDCSHSLAALCFELMSDKAVPSMLPSILSLMLRYPLLVPLLPKFKDTRKHKLPEIDGIGNDMDPISPLATLLNEVCLVIQQNAGDFITSHEEWDGRPPAPVQETVVQLSPFRLLEEQAEIMRAVHRAGANADSELSDTGGDTVAESVTRGGGDDIGSAAFEDMKSRKSYLFGKIRSESWVVAAISNFACNRRGLTEISSAQTATPTSSLTVPAPAVGGEGAVVGLSSLSLSLDDLDRFSGLPLSSLELEKYICHVSREDANLGLVGGSLPFEVDSHDQAKSAIAQSMLSRLRTDMAEFASAKNQEVTPKMRFLLSLDAMNVDQSVDLLGTISAATAELDGLIAALEALRASDSKFVEDSLPWIQSMANSVDSTSTSVVAEPKRQDVMSVDDQEASAGGGGSGSPAGNPVAPPAVAVASVSVGTDNDRVMFELKRFCRQEVTLWLEFLLGTLLSSVQSYDVTLLNPFLSTEKIELLNGVMVAAIFHANRVGMINRCASLAQDLKKSLKTLRTTLSSDTATDVVTVHITVDKHLAAVQLKGESLAKELLMSRHFIDSAEKTGGEKKRRRTDNFYDPRFLLFEFTWLVQARPTSIFTGLRVKRSVRYFFSWLKEASRFSSTIIVCPCCAGICSCVALR